MCDRGGGQKKCHCLQHSYSVNGTFRSHLLLGSTPFVISPIKDSTMKITLNFEKERIIRQVYSNIVSFEVDNDNKTYWLGSTWEENQSKTYEIHMSCFGFHIMNGLMMISHKHQLMCWLAYKSIAFVSMSTHTSMLKSTPAQKKYTTAGCVVVTNISYGQAGEQKSNSLLFCRAMAGSVS